MFGVQGGRGNDEDQFYTPVKVRRSKKYIQKQQQQKQVAGASSEERDESKSKMENSGKKCSAQISNLMGLPPFGHCDNSISNLDRFLESTTPLVLSQYFSKTTMRGWKTCDVEYQYFFTLGDLWESFTEWSAYGAGVPLVVDGYDYGVVQYYVPYLSAIQLYGGSSGSNDNSRWKNNNLLDNAEGTKCDRLGWRAEDRSRALISWLAGKDNDSTGSDGSSDYEVEEGLDLSWLQQGSKTGENKENLPSLDKDCRAREGFSSEDNEVGSSRCQLLYEFLEQETPYCREPLSEKIAELANSYPELKTLRSYDLLARSWMSVAWYPIYRIPTGPTLKDLDACFLTYHYLSTPSKDSEGNGCKESPTLVHEREDDEVARFSLPAFAVAAYKFKGSMWTPRDGGRDFPLVNSLMQAANNWLRLLQVQHPDFQFFVSRGSYQR